MLVPPRKGYRTKINFGLSSLAYKFNAMRKLYFVSLILIWSVAASAQIIPISNGSINTCSGTFTDSGMESGGYGANEDLTFTICPGTQGGNIRLSFTEADFRPGDILCFYDGTSTNEPLIACSNNFQNDEFIIQATKQTGCLTTVFVSNAYQEADGWKADISCSPNCQEIKAQLTNSTPAVINNHIDICVGTEVALNATALFPNNDQNYHQSINNSTFTWSFGNGVTLQGQQVSYDFPEGGGNSVSLTVTDQYGCESTNSIDLNMRVAEKPTFSTVSNLIPDLCANQTLNLSASANEGEGDIQITQPGSAFSMVKSLSDSLALPDGTGASYVSNIFYNEFNPGQTLQNENDLKNIFVNMEHSWLRDIEISIECPNGQKAVLVHHPGNTGGEVFLGEPNELDEGLASPVPGIGYKYEWKSNASNPNWIEYINQHLPSTLPAGVYQPTEPFSQLEGCPLNGNWKLDVIDSWASDNGFIFAWGLEFDESLYPEGETYTPSIEDIQWTDNTLVTSNNGDNINIRSNTAGKKYFQLEVTNDFGCKVDTQFAVNVLPPTSPLCYDCGDFKMELRDTAICPGQSITYDASFDKSQIDVLGYKNVIDKAFTGTFQDNLTVTNVKPGKIGSVNYRIEAIEFTLNPTQATSYDVSIQSPDGKKIVLGTGINLSTKQNIRFEPNATQALSSATAPFSASYKPKEDWSKLQAASINGDWKINITANNTGSTEFIDWGISFKNDVSIGYHWTGNGLSCTDCPTPSVTPTKSSEFIVEVYDNYNCAYSDTISITIIEALSPPVIHEPTTEDGKIVFTWEPVDNASGYLVKVNNTNWITPNGALSQTLDGYVLGDEISFSVKALSAGGCDGSDANIQLKITDCLLTSGYTITKAPACQGIDDGEILVTATNGTPTIQFTLDGDIANTTGSFTNLSTGNHFVITADDAGCTDTLVFILDPIKNLGIDISTTDITCFGANNGSATANVTGGATAPVTYNWLTTPMQNTQTISNLNSGVYTLNITDGDGCSLAQNVTISEPTELTSIFENTQNISCFGASDGSTTVKASGGNGPYTYLWNTGETTQTLSNKTSGIYTVTITDVNLCTTTNTVSLTQPNTALSLSANQTIKACAYTKNGKAIAIATGGFTPYNYQWSDNQNNAIANHLAPGNYSVTVTDNSGCQKSTTLSITEYEEIVPTLDFTEPTCHEGSNASVTVTSITGGSSSNLTDYTYQWLGQSDTDNTIENLTGDRSYYVTVTGTNGCKGVQSILVTQPDPIQIELAATPVTCAGNNDGKVEVLSITGNAGPYNLQWGANAHHATTNEVTDLGGDLYYVTATNALGCTGSNFIQVKEAQPFKISKLESTDPNCFGESNGHATINTEGGVGPYSYQWSNGSITSGISNAANGTYTVTITDGYNCILEDSVILNQPSPVSALTEIVTPKCFGENTASITINATGGTGAYEYSLNNNSFSADPVLNEMLAGTYPIYIKDEHDCLFVDTVSITQPPAFTLDAGPDLKLDYAEATEISIDVDNAQGDIIVLVVDPLGNSTTCNGCYEVNIIPKYHGEYSIVATDENGCMATDIIDVLIERDQKFLVPTAFTPNNDEINDFLTCHTKNEAKVNFFRVYDRWGGLIFESTSGVTNQPKQGWDGTSRGKPMPSGTYIWTASVLFDNGVRETFKGQTNLIR